MSDYPVYTVDVITQSKPHKKYTYLIRALCKRDAERAILDIHKENEDFLTIGWIGSRRASKQYLLRIVNEFKITPLVKTYLLEVIITRRKAPVTEDNHDKNINSTNDSIDQFVSSLPGLRNIRSAIARLNRGEYAWIRCDLPWKYWRTGSLVSIRGRSI
jgi:hypothetical protein